MRAKLLAAAGVTATFAFASAAFAASPTGYIDGGYTNFSANGVTGAVNDWNVTGAGDFPLGASDFSLQVDANYHDLTTSGLNSHTDQAELSLIWAHPMARIGATAGVNELGGGGGSAVHYQNYGGFAVFYPNQRWTLGVKGSSLTCSGCGAFTTWGGEVVGYATPDLALNVGFDRVDVVHGRNLNTWSVGGEWQPTPRPWAVRLRYGNTKLPGGPTINAYGVGVRWYFGGSGSLVKHHREGAETWGTTQRGLLIFY
jgi:hypothetical protein